MTQVETHFDPDEVEDILARHFGNRNVMSGVIAGPTDDDCAVVPLGNHYLVISSDFLNARPIVEQFGIDNWRCLGRLTVAATVSDLCGTGVHPAWMQFAATVPKSTSRDEYEELVIGVAEEATKWGVQVVGGDTKLGPARSLLASGFGIAKSLESLFLSFRALPTHAVFASGPLGGCAAATLVLANKDRFKADIELATDLLSNPVLPMTKSSHVSRMNLNAAGIDLSDGLGSDLTTLCRKSDVGVRVDAEKLPIHPLAQKVALAFGVPCWAMAFAIGGDFQFIVTAPREKSDQIREIGLTEIGMCTESKIRSLLLPNGTVIDLPKRGHRDARQMTFSEEVLHLIMGLSNASP